MGVSVAEGTIVGWPVSVGEPIAADAPICEISTDKIDVEVPSPVSGVVSEILAEVGETVAVGTVIARIATSDAPAPEVAPPAQSTRNGHERRHYSPVVQRIAAEHGVDLSAVTGTGRDGRVRKPDVLAFIESSGGGAAVEEPPMHIESPYRPDPVPQPSQPGTLSRMRRSIGEHMKRSLETAATCTTWTEVDMSRIEAARTSLKLTALPFVARACVAALREQPALNAWLEGETYTRHDSVHLGIAVSLGDDGLIVPVVHDAHELSVEGLSTRIRDLARRARDRQLTPDDVRGGTFTITNPGQYGSIMATPIINLPQVGILDLEAVVKRPVVLTDADGNDSIAIRPITILGLSWDHRALDGVQAAQFLAAVKRHLEGWTGA
jgi:2-oxoglutarate dehydrogenase E2 component (dihydrolipoamide succinyltransferase)